MRFSFGRVYFNCALCTVQYNRDEKVIQRFEMCNGWVLSTIFFSAFFRFHGRNMQVNTLYPNHDVEYSTDGETWHIVTNDEEQSQKILYKKNISLRAV